MAIKTVSPEKVSLLRFDLENGDARGKKVALQEIAQIYRSRIVFNSEDRNGIELTINGLLSSSQEPKVTRWCLNCIAQLGTRNGSLSTVERVLRQHLADPEITAAAVAAIVRLYHGKLDECDALGSVQPEIKTLAALQVTSPANIDLSGFRIHLDCADDVVLKLALITVGLNRAVENLFHPKHTNGTLVKALGQHENAIVKQYSVWSIIENPNLNIENLGIAFSSIESQPSNIQSKLLQLAATKMADKRELQRIIRQGSFLLSVDAREGLATGLLKKFYEGLQDVTLDWFNVESDDRVKVLLAEHFARHSSKCGPYEDKSIELFDSNTMLRTRLYIGSERTSLYQKLKKMDLRGANLDLFEGADPLVDVLSQRNMKMKNVLMMCVSPKDNTPLRLDAEARDLKEQLRLVENCKVKVSVDHAWAIKIQQIQTELLNHKPHILHFSGHGNRGILCFEDNDGNTTVVPTSAIVDLIKLIDSIECVVLNACHTNEMAQQISPYIEVVIGCNDTIVDDAAIAFSRGFYRALSHGKPYQKAFDLARNEVSLSGMDVEAKKYQFFPQHRVT